MTKVITYGTYDLLHYGHIRLLERAKALGDYLIVGVTADDFDKTRGKINVKQSLMERVEAVRSTGIADEIIIEEYEGQKIDDIKRYGVDIFTVGSDWEGKFDYLNEYCRVVYLQRTEGVSSSEIRAEERTLRLGIVGDHFNFVTKNIKECSFVNGLSVSSVYTDNENIASYLKREGIVHARSYSELLDEADAVYIASQPSKHFEQAMRALESGKHVLCESPVALTRSECQRLFDFAHTKGLSLVESLKTAYSTAYNRLLLLVKSGRIGRIYSVDAVCTSLHDVSAYDQDDFRMNWNSLCDWGPTAMLPVFQILGTDYYEKRITTALADRKTRFDVFTKIDFRYPQAVASIRVGKGVKSEGELVISGEKGYIYVPAPWWKTDYFEIRYENPAENKRYFYQLDGEGIRYELVAFSKSIENKRDDFYISRAQSEKISEVVEDFYSGKDVVEIRYEAD